MKKLSIISLILGVVLFTGLGTAWSLTSLPTLDYTGVASSTESAGAVSLSLNAITTINRAKYINGSSTNANNSEETIIDATVSLSGAVNGDCSTASYGYIFFPSTATITIAGQDSFVYLTADLSYLPPGSNVLFLFDGTRWLLYPPTLDASDPTLLNLSNIHTYTDAGHPSRYIAEIAAALTGTSTDILGMTMILTPQPESGNLCGGNAVGTFSVQGIIDGSPNYSPPSNTPPVANAGDDKTIPSHQVATTTIYGIVTDVDDASVLTCRWTEGATILQDWTAVGITGECTLDLSTTALGIGTHTLTLEGDDGVATSSDDMILTINNSVPNANAGPDVTITSEEVAAATIAGTTTDFDNGDMLYCKWTEGTTLLQDWTLAGVNGECPLSGLSLGRGIHTLTLEATDGQAVSSDDMVLTINNTPPIANAGENVTVTSDQIAATEIQGSATDFDGDAISCRWTEGAILLQDWTPAGLGGECVLSLNSLSFSLGAHTLTFEASDGQVISSNNMILTVNNSAPHAAPGGAGVYEINTPVILPGDASDFDGDLLYYEWTEGATVLCSGNIQSIAGGTSVLLPDCAVSGLGLGMHTVTLQVTDGFNVPDTKSVTVQIVDNSAPTLKPVANKYILWPPNHKMVDIAIAANATDNSGCPVTLNASVTSNEPQFGLNGGDQGPDWTEPVIDQATGTIYLQLRAERSGRGKGRKYTITITATDCSGNVSTAKVRIRVPHDQDNDDRKREDREEHGRDDRHDKKDCNDDRDD